MKYLMFAILLTSSFGFAKPTTVSSVDLSRYAGKWYQIMHRPLFFEFRRPCACARQKLSPNEDGTIAVYNSCNIETPQGPLYEITGVATNLDPKTNAKFKVDFHLPNKGSYWIVGLDENYRWAVVTDRFAYSLYILSKTPTLPENQLAAALEIAKSQNLKVQLLEKTVQENCSYPD